MTRAQLELHLAEAEAAVSLATAQVERRRLLVAALEEAGQPAAAKEARNALSKFERTLRLCVKVRDRVRLELAAETKSGGS